MNSYRPLKYITDDQFFSEIISQKTATCKLAERERERERERDINVRSSRRTRTLVYIYDVIPSFINTCVEFLNIFLFL